jgi:hypothetical protein
LISVIFYNPNRKEAWNAFIRRSKNGTFMLGRDYLEYHADRFEDCSLMLHEGETLKAVLPASRHGREIRSHGGLTYGGLICGLDMTAPLMLECFRALSAFLAGEGAGILLYKRVPWIYHRYPADEDLQALFVHRARLVRRDLSSCIYLPDRIGFNERRRRNLKKALKAGLEVRETRNYTAYIELLADVLSERYQTAPVHTAAEMEHLARLHPENIRLFAAYRGPNLLAGTLVYETPLVAHTQYLASNAEGRATGALDLVIAYLVEDVYQDKRYFDFGISTEHNGLHLNEGLVGQKQEFGGRGVVHDFYELDLTGEK